MRLRRTITDQQGFTLLELMIALSLMAIALLATAKMQGVASKSNSFANQSVVMTALAQDVMEEFMSKDRTDIRLTQNATDVNYIGLNQSSLATDLTFTSAGQYRVTYTVQPLVSGGTLTTIRQIDITVSRINPATGVAYTGFGATTKMTGFRSLR